MKNKIIKLIKTIMVIKNFIYGNLKCNKWDLQNFSSKINFRIYNKISFRVKIVVN